MNNTQGSRTQKEGGEASQSRSGPHFVLFGIFAMVCCAIPLLIAGGGLAFLSVISGQYALLFAGAAIVVILLVVGITVRGESRKRSRRTKTNGDACCQ